MSATFESVGSKRFRSLWLSFHEGLGFSVQADWTLNALMVLREAVRLPVVRQMPEVVVERPIFLQEHDNVIDSGDVLRGRRLCKRDAHVYALTTR